MFIYQRVYLINHNFQPLESPSVLLDFGSSRFKSAFASAKASLAAQVSIIKSLEHLGLYTTKLIIFTSTIDINRWCYNNFSDFHIWCRLNFETSKSSALESRFPHWTAITWLILLFKQPHLGNGFKRNCGNFQGLASKMTVDAGQKDIGRFFEAKNTHTNFANKSKKQSQHTFSVRTGANAFAFPKMVGPVTTKLVYFANLPGSLVQALHSPTLHIFSWLFSIWLLASLAFQAVILASLAAQCPAKLELLEASAWWAACLVDPAREGWQRLAWGRWQLAAWAWAAPCRGAEGRWVGSNPSRESTSDSTRSLAQGTFSWILFNLFLPYFFLPIEIWRHTYSNFACTTGANDKTTFPQCLITRYFTVCLGWPTPQASDVCWFIYVYLLPI